MLVNLSQYKVTVGPSNNEFIPNRQWNIFYYAFFRNLDILAIISVLFSIFIYDCDVISYKWSILHIIKR